MNTKNKLRKCHVHFHVPSNTISHDDTVHHSSLHCNYWATILICFLSEPKFENKKIEQVAKFDGHGLTKAHMYKILNGFG